MRFINDVTDIFDTYFGFMGVSAPDGREIEEGDYLLLGTAQDQDSAENICKKLNELEEKNAELRKENYGYIDGLAYYTEENGSLSERISELENSLDCLMRENIQLKEKNEKLHDEIFRLRTELAYDRTEKEEHSDTVYDFEKKLESW